MLAWELHVLRVEDGLDNEAEARLKYDFGNGLLFWKLKPRVGFELSVDITVG